MLIPGWKVLATGRTDGEESGASSKPATRISVISICQLSTSGPGRKGWQVHVGSFGGEFGNRTVVKLWWYVGPPRGWCGTLVQGDGGGRSYPRDHCVPGAIWIRTMSFG